MASQFSLNEYFSLICLFSKAIIQNGFILSLGTHLHLNASSCTSHTLLAVSLPSNSRPSKCALIPIPRYHFTVTLFGNLSFLPFFLFPLSCHSCALLLYFPNKIREICIYPQPLLATLTYRPLQG